MTPKLLSEYRDIKREINLLDEEVRTNDNTYSKVMSSMTEHPYIAVELTVGNELSEATLEQLKKRRKTLQEKRSSIETFIDSVNDSKIRQIIALRYIRGLTWNQVAFNMDWTDEQIPRKMISKYFYKKVRKVRK